MVTDSPSQNPDRAQLAHDSASLALNLSEYLLPCASTYWFAAS